MFGNDTGTVRMACVVKLTRGDLQTLMRQGWVLVGDGEDRRNETRRERRERRQNQPDPSELIEMSPRERDAGIEAAEENAELSALLYLNGAERKGDPDTSLDFDSYVSLNISLESFHRLMDGETVKWGERYGRPLYVDSEGTRNIQEQRDD